MNLFRFLTTSVLTLGSFQPATAQATFSGAVLDDSARSPVPDVEVIGGKRSVQTSAQGRFVLSDLSPGVHVVLFRRLGYRPVRVRLVVVTGDTVERMITMTRAQVELPPIEVVAGNVPPGMERFAERRAMGRGTFFDTKVMRSSEHRRLRDLITTVAGVKWVYTRVSGGRLIPSIVSKRSGAGMGAVCRMAIWLDGVQIYAPTALGGSQPPDLDNFKIHDLEAAELYPGPSSVPPELGGTGAICGAMVLWSRRR